MRTAGSRRLWRVGIGVVCLFFSVQGVARAVEKPPHIYPEKGKVVASHISEHTDYVPLTTDSKGRTHGGQSYVYRKWVYRVETDDGFYELEGGKKSSMAVGDAVEFRIEKGTGRVRTGDKEKKYLIVSTTPKPTG